MRIIRWLSSEEARKNKAIDVVAVACMAMIWLSESFLSNHLWGSKQAPFVDITWGHLTFFLVSAGLPVLWFFVVRKHPLSYLGLKRANHRRWYLLALLGVPVTFGFGIPTYLGIVKVIPALSGGGMAGTPPPLNHPLHVVLLVELVKYPLTAAIPHELAYRGAAFRSIRALGKYWFLVAALISTALFIAYHLPFDLSFSAVHFNLIISVVALFLLEKSGSLIPPMIFHSAIDLFAIFASWGYYLGK